MFHRPGSERSGLSTSLGVTEAPSELALQKAEDWIDQPGSPEAAESIASEAETAVDRSAGRLAVGRRGSTGRGLFR